jgi:Ca2+-binding RTX toxin-like protein
VNRRRPRSRGLIAVKSALAILGALVLISTAAFTAGNVVPVTNADNPVQPIDPDDLAPSECDGIALTTTISGTGIIAGSAGNDWIVGSGVIDTISGLAGDDCIEGREGADSIDGGPGNDVCIGGPGLDTFLGCETQIQ